jgi:hypothetical protein
VFSKSQQRLIQAKQGADPFSSVFESKAEVSQADNWNLISLQDVVKSIQKQQKLEDR